MQETRAHGRWSLVALSVLTIAGMAGCDDYEGDSNATSEATVCSTVGTTWWNQQVAAQNRRFYVELAVTPSRSNTDAVVGLSPGAATQWASLAAIVRFNAQGRIDARAGSTYRADTVVPYQGGTTYYVRFHVNVESRTYSVAVGTQPGNYPSVVAQNYPFRTEHANATWLDHVAAYVDPSVGGTVALCDVSVIEDGTTSCVASTPGGGFTNRGVLASSTATNITLYAHPSSTNMDGVIGVTNGPADSFSDLAAALRFAANGRIEARDGDVYRADTEMTYIAGQSYRVQLVIDLPSKTYSVFVRSYPGGETTQLARGYRFRTQQASVARLDNVAAIVDSTNGRLDTCDLRGGPDPRLLAIRDGTHDVHPLADGSALISDGARTIRVDAGNVPRGSIAAGGNVTADTAGNVYIASVASGSLTVRAYSSALAARWTQSYAVSGSEVVDSVVTNAGHVVVALRSSTGFNLALIDSFGPLRAVSSVNGTAISLSANNFAVAMALSDGNEVQVWRYGDPPGLIRTRQLIGPFNIARMSIALDDSIVFGGSLQGPMDFGSCAISPFVHPEVYWDAYVTAMRSDLSTRFCTRLTTEVTGIAHDTSRIAVAYHTRTQLPYVDTVVYDPNGNTIGGTAEDAFVGAFGKPGGVALASNGRLYLNIFASLEGPVDRRWPFLVTLSP
jgi:hypothetical protein